jgi:arsenite methyltransferase
MSLAMVDAVALPDHVRELYRAVARDPRGVFHYETGGAFAARLGYPAGWLDVVPSGALAAFAGVGHMLDLAEIQPGETVLDLGCGAGTDAFIAAHLTGPDGQVIGIDMTDAQLATARWSRDEAGLDHVAFFDGLIEAPPVHDESVDVVIANGVINLAPDKHRVFAAVARALRPGGRLAVADLVSERELIEPALWAACIVPQERYLGAIEAAGLRIDAIRANPAFEASDNYDVTSVTVLARKA